MIFGEQSRYVVEHRTNGEPPLLREGSVRGQTAASREPGSPFRVFPWAHAANVVPLSGNRDVVGPIARNVCDAALCLDVRAGYSAEDSKTLASVGKIPPKGYAADLHYDALKGKRIGLHGPGWRTQPLSVEAPQLYLRMQLS